jgi:Family of unknown function (DUF5362)
MQTEDLLQQDVFDGAITEESKTQLTGVSQWMQISAITGFASLAVSVISTVVLYVRLSSIGFGGGAVGSSGIFRLLLTAAVSIIMNVLLLQAASNIKKGLAMHDQQFFNTGMARMATYFKVMGILIIVGLSLLLLILFFGMLYSGFR